MTERSSTSALNTFNPRSTLPRPTLVPHARLTTTSGTCGYGHRWLRKRVARAGSQRGPGRSGIALLACSLLPLLAHRQRRALGSAASLARKLDWRKRSVDHLSNGGSMFTADLVLGRGKG